MTQVLNVATSINPTHRSEAPQDSLLGTLRHLSHHLQQLFVLYTVAPSFYQTRKTSHQPSRNWDGTYFYPALSFWKVRGDWRVDLFDIFPCNVAEGDSSTERQLFVEGSWSRLIQNSIPKERGRFCQVRNHFEYEPGWFGFLKKIRHIIVQYSKFSLQAHNWDIEKVCL